MVAPQQSFLTETGFQAYSKYLALKRHFSSSYDYFKYNGKTNASFDSFVARKDAPIFQKLGKKPEYENILLANIVLNPKIWAGALLEEPARQTYLNWKKKTDAITVHIKDSLEVLDDDFKSNFVVDNGQYPYIIDLYLQQRLSLETVTILTKITNSQSYWNQSVVDKVLFPDIMKQIDKYHPFLVYSKEKISLSIKDHFFSVIQ